MIGKSISHYKILEKIGEGGMGVVYKAEDTKLKRTVALKFLPPELTRDSEAKKRFMHEAQAASALEHNNICNIHEIDETEDGQTFLVMACYEGETLKQKTGRAPLAVKDVVNTAIQIAQGLEEVHNKGIVHRDIKPSNIYVTDKNIVKIVDFGLAKLTDRSKLTDTGTTLGTVSYMSPEQTRGDNVDHRTDIWSLGVILYEMITGQTPFKGQYDQAVMYGIMNESPEPITALRSGLSLELERIVHKCLEKNPSERYQHADELLVDLQKIKRTSDSGEVVPIIQEKRKKKRILLYSLIMSVVIVMAVLGYILFSPPTKKAPASIRIKLVVLPFENLGPTDHDYFADGMTEEITSRLATISALGVISRKSALYYAKKETPIQQIGKELGVDYILEGTVRWAVTPEGEKVRITPQLIRVSDDTHVWAENYEKLIDDIFTIQTEIAMNVAEQLGITLLEAERLEVEIPPTQNMEAYHAYLRGRYYAGRPHFTLDNWQRAMESYQQALELDPGFALAYAELAKVHAIFYHLRYDLSEKCLEKAKHAADKAMELGPDQPEIRLALSYYHSWALNDSKKAFEDLTFAQQSMPNNADILKAKADILQPQGRWQEYIHTLERAFELSPRDASIAFGIAGGLWMTRQYGKAAEACGQAITLAPDETWPYLYMAFINWSWKGANDASRSALKSVPPDHEWYLWAWYWQEVGEGDFQAALERLSGSPDSWIRHKMWARPKSMLSAFIYDYLNKHEPARDGYESAGKLLEKEVKAHPDDPRYHSSLGIAYAALGQKEKAIKEGKRAVELLPISKDALYGQSHLYDLAIIYAMVGEYDAALDQIEYLLSIPSFISDPWLKMDIHFAPLRTLPRYKALMKKYSVDKG